MANTYKTTETFTLLVEAYKKYQTVILQGGQGSSKTTSVLQMYIFICMSKDKGLILSVIADTMPNLKSNAIRIFEKLLKDMGVWSEFKVNSVDKTYEHKKTGNIIEFFSVDSDSSRLGARRSHLYICEADNIKLETYLAVAGRSGRVVMDYNPRFKFWVHTELEGESHVKLIIVNHSHNEYIPKGEMDMLLWYKRKAYHDPDITDLKKLNKKANIKSKYYLNKWKVFGLGMLGIAEGLIFEEYEDWNIIDTLPREAKYIGSGLDFGFTHVSAIVKLFRWNDKIILKEVLFKKGLTASRLANFIKSDAQLLSSVIAADESRPEMIEEIFSSGVPVDAAKKGAGSVDLGLDLMHSHEILVTSDSVNLIKELRAYSYATDKNNRSLGVPDKAKDMDNAIDAARYAFRYFLSLVRSLGYELKKVM